MREQRQRAFLSRIGIDTTGECGKKVIGLIAQVFDDAELGPIERRLLNMKFGLGDLEPRSYQQISFQTFYEFSLTETEVQARIERDLGRVTTVAKQLAA